MRARLLWFVLLLSLTAKPGLIRAEETPLAPAMDLKQLYEEAIREMEAGHYEIALEHFQAILLIKPDMPVIHNLIGIVYLRDSKPELAEGAFLNAVQYDPKYAEAYFNLATLYMGEDADKQVAADYYRQAIAADPSYAKAYFGLGWIELLENDNAEDAIQHFEKVVEIAPDFIEAQYGLAMAYLRLNKRAMALQPLSILRSLNRYDLVERVEKMMEEPSEAPLEEAAYPMEGPAGPLPLPEQPGAETAPADETSTGMPLS